jgi:hypothetical protein
MPRQFFAIPGLIFTTKSVTDDDNWIQLRIVAADITHDGHNDDNPTKGTVTCELTKFQNPLAPVAIASETFSGGFRQAKNKVVFKFHDIYFRTHSFKLIVTLHKTKGFKDQITLRTTDGLEQLFQCLGNPDGSNTGGTPADPDAETMQRAGGSVGPINIPAGGTTTGPQPGSIQPGSVFVNVTAPAPTTLYDFNRQLFAVGDPFTPVGTVDYGPGMTNTWTVNLNVPSTATVFAAKN